MYFIKSKTGSVYEFSTIEEAIGAAKEKSTKVAAFSVYEDGNNVPIAAFQNKKRLENWKNIYSIVHHPMYDNDNMSPYAHAMRTTYERIDQSLDNKKIRYKARVQILYHGKDGRVHSTMKTESLTFHRNGIVNYYNGKQVRCVTYNALRCTISASAFESLCQAILNLRPELQPVAKFLNKLDVVNAFSRPCECFVADSFTRKYVLRHYVEASELHKLFPREFMDENELIKHLCKKLKLPTSKTFRRLYAQSIRNIVRIKQIMEFGFHDVNNVLKVSHLLAETFSDSKQVLLDMISVRGENSVTRMVVEQDISLIRDITLMASRIPETIRKFVYKEAKNFQEIHDTFTVYINIHRGEMVNIEIPYDKKELTLNKTYGNIRFELAKDTLDLAVVGAEMGICVGGYAVPAVDKQCTIVKLMEGAKHIGCIELRGKSINQVKAKFNNPLKIEYKAVLDKWIKETGVKPECNDYYHIGEEWYSTHDYHYVNPRAFARHEHREELRIVTSATRYVKHTPYWAYPLDSTNNPYD